MKKLLRGIYNIVPFKQGIFKVVRAFHPGKSLTRHLVFNGEIDVKMGGQSFKMINRGYFLEQLFFWEGLDKWEKYSSYLWRVLSAHSNVVLDIGANTGVYTLMTKTINPNATVYAFEPVDKIFEVLKANITANNLQNTHAVNKAVSNAEGVMDMYDVKDGNLYEASLEAAYIDNLSYDKNRFVKKSVAIDTVDHFVSSHNIKQVDLVKIDVETHEPKVMEGMQICLLKSKPIVLVEILNQQVADGIKPFLKGDYVLYNINEDKGYEEVKELNPSSHFNYVICHREKEPLLKRAMSEAMAMIRK